jgi:hypothetical protein
MVQFSGGRSLCVTLLNSIGIVYLIVNKNRQTIQSDKIDSAIKIPNGLKTDDNKIELFNKFKTLYNTKDFEGIYLLLDESARYKTPKEDIIKGINFVHEEAGLIKGGSYSHYDIQSIGKLTDVLTFIYTIQLEKRNGRLSISVLTSDKDNYKIVNFNIAIEK